jgi:formylglycine-generating enzyme
MVKNLSAHVGLGLVALIVGFASSASAEVTFEWVTVGNPGNAADPLNSGSTPGIGTVDYVYRISKYEVTNDQWAEFLNAVAATDPNELYNGNMSITQSGSPGSHTYTVHANRGNKPVNFVSYFDVMRFVNWLHNGQPTGSQDASTTEDGVYLISDGVSETRAPGAKFFIPSRNEWYKAAYHQPSAVGGDADNYWLYPTASNAVPTVATADANGDITNPGANVANYNNGVLNVTTVGSAGPLSQSYYGTFDQGGNVWEWHETVISGIARGVRGGTWNASHTDLRSQFQDNVDPASGDPFGGFRVASSVGDIPAVSDWGLAVMVLSILTAGTIVRCKRVPHAA